MKKVAFERGITLVALVITIIVLLILAGVTLNMILGEDGLIEKAKRSAIVTELKELQEKVDIAIAAETVKAQKENRKFDISEYETLNSLGIESKYSEYSEVIGVTSGKIYMKNVATEEMKVAAQSIGVKIRRLHEGYQEVEYVESTGTQYIDTKYLPNSNTKMELEASFLNETIFEQFGCIKMITSVTYSRWHFGTFQGKLQMFRDQGSAGNNLKINYDSNFHKYYLDNWTTKIDDYEQKLNDDDVLDTSLSFYLFARNNILSLNETPAVGNYASARLKSFKIWDNNILVRDMIPCYYINSENNEEIGLYDLVNGEFYTNQGTGVFIKGNDV